MKKILGIMAVFVVILGIAQSVQAEQAVVCPAGYICTKIVSSAPAVNPQVRTQDASVTNRINSDEVWTTGSVTPPCYTFNSNRSESDFSNNSLGKEMIALQKYLISSGYKDVILSGRFDARTKTAVMSYQEKKGIPSTGYVGPLTRAVLNGAVCINPVKATPSLVGTTAVGSSPRISSISTSNVRVNDIVTLRGANFDGVRSELLYITNTTGSISPEIVASSNSSVVFKVPNIPAGTYYVYLASNTGISNKMVMNVSSNVSLNVYTNCKSDTTKKEAIRQLYLKLQKREPDQAGWDYWTCDTRSLSQIESDMKAGFEYVAKQQMVVLSNQILGRAPTDSEINQWYLVIYNTQTGAIDYNPLIAKLNAMKGPVTNAVSTAPKINSITKSSVKVGDTVGIRGTNFDGVRSELLYITNTTGSISPEIISNSPVSVYFTVPNIPAGAYYVYLTANGGTSDKVLMNVEAKVEAPVISNVSITSAKYNDLVTIRGKGFKGVRSELLYITNANGSISPEVTSTPTDSVLVFRTPNIPAGDYQIYLAADGGISNKVPFSVFIPKSTAPIE